MALPSAVRNLRGEFLTGTDRNTQKPLEDAWYTKNLKALLDAHYDVFKGTALNDIECMRETEHTKMKITKQRREDKSLPLPPVALRILGEWYDEKMAKLREEEGPEVVERDCKYRAARRAQTEELHGRHDNHDKDLAEIKAGVEKLIGLHESFYVEEEEAEEKAAKEAAAKEAAAKKAEEKAAKEAAAKEAAAKEAEEAAAKEAAAKEAAAKKAEEKATKEAAAKEAAAKKAEEKAAKEAAAKETAAKEAEEAAAKEAAAKEAAAKEAEEAAAKEAAEAEAKAAKEAEEAAAKDAAAKETAAKEAEEAAAKEAAEAEAKAAKEAAAKEAAAKEALSVEAENEESDELSKDEIERRLELLQVDWKKTRAEIDLHKEPTMEWKRLHHRLCDITDSKAALIRMQQRMLFKALKAQEEDEESRMNERLSHSWLAQDHMDLLDALDKDDVSIEGLRKLAWSFKNFKNTPRCRNPVEEKKELAEAKQ